MMLTKAVDIFYSGLNCVMIDKKKQKREIIIIILPAFRDKE